MFKRRTPWRIVLLFGLLSLLLLTVYYSFNMQKNSSAAECIGVIEITEPLLSTRISSEYVSMINYAAENSSVKAVVLKIDNPGGYVSAVQEVYLSLLKLKAKKPVVASILGEALSGGYYIAVASDYIYALPSSLVGSVGVIGILPPRPSPSEGVVETGPYKYTGVPELEYYSMIDEVLENFLDAISLQRGEKLIVSKSELKEALIYTGMRARQIGLVDELGNFLDAVEKAAELAKLKKYEIVSINNELVPKLSLSTVQLTNATSLEELLRFSTPPSLYYMYVPSSGPLLGIEQYSGASVVYSQLDTSRSVAFDVAHKNAFTTSDVELLIRELSYREWSVSFVSDVKSVAKGKYHALVLISPLTVYSEDERRAIKEFVDKGGKLLLIYDPTYSSPHAINSISSDFGIVFADGYLFNLVSYDRNYRNIYVTDFGQNCSVVKGLSKLVFFTASAVFSLQGGAAFADNCYLSTSSTMSNYPVVALNKNVVAVGDQTFLREPYAHLYDNYQLIYNLVDFITS